MQLTLPLLLYMILCHIQGLGLKYWSVKHDVELTVL